MLNRRILRAKAMQHIYAFKQCQRSNYELAFDHVHEAFQPDLNSMEVQDKEKLAKDEAAAKELLKAYFEKKDSFSEALPYMERVLKDAVVQYENQCRRDRQYLLRQMIETTEQIADHYMLLLLLLPALADESVADRPRRSVLNPDMPAPAVAPKLNFYNNRVIKAIQHNQRLYTEAKNKNLHWSEHREEIRHWFRNFVKSEEAFQKYQGLENTTVADDIEIIRHIFNNVILKHEIITAIAEENDINWAENKKAIKSMANKSIKSVSDENPEYIEIVDLTPNWEEDKEFFENLYNLVLQHDEEYEEIIMQKAKNWSADRIASLDNIIIKMAIAEMTHFSSIPVKVTINEYIDISKQYSTHKSKQFVNGMLDVIAEDLQNKNLIRKSGRGLIDNQ